MGFKKIGDWNKVVSLVFSISKGMEKARETSLKRFGLKVEGLAKTHISTQDLNWKPLSPTYKAWKLRGGGKNNTKKLSENILVATSTYFQSITSWVDGETVYAGVRREASYADGAKVANIAAVHEFGSPSRNIPARPLWKPSYKEAIAWHKTSNSPEKLFLENIKKKYGI
jgi:hypothetical protein